MRNYKLKIIINTIEMTININPMIDFNLNFSLRIINENNIVNKIDNLLILLITIGEELIIL